MQTLAFNTVDVFTSRPFSGNSLAIVHDADALTDQQMQLMAREFNLPETIFIQQASDKSNTAKVRIFTPANEIPFAGHPTIGCAIWLAEQHNKNNANDKLKDATGNDEDFSTEIRLEEVAGLVPVGVERCRGEIRAQLTAPVIPTPAKLKALDSDITLNSANAAKAMGIQVSDIETSNAVPMSHTGGPTFLFIPLNNRKALSQAKAIEPLCTELSHAYGATGIYVYYLDTPTNAVDARMFAPAAGIPEDPATGSATALLASQLKEAKQLVEGENNFSLRQGYDMGRPSDLTLTIELALAEIKTVKVSGSSTPISSGQIRVPFL